MLRVMFSIALSAMLVFAGPLQAREFGGVDFPDKLALPGTSKTVQLNGVGYRKKLFIKVYIGALYTEKPARSRDDVIDMKGPRRIVMHIVYDEISKKKLVDAWNEGFENNLSDDELDKLRGAIDKFNAMFSAVKAGHEIDIDYVPGAGTRVTINGEPKGVIPGREFNNARVDIWLGDKPADGGLKKAMLGG